MARVNYRKCIRKAERMVRTASFSPYLYEVRRSWAIRLVVTRALRRGRPA